MKPVDLRTEFANEKELEQYIVDHPDFFFPEWWLVGRQLRTDEGEADLVYVHGDLGWLFVVELKLGNADRRTIGQVAEYTEFLSSLTPTDLSIHISNSSGKDDVAEIADFSAEWTERFGPEKDFSEMPICAIVAGTSMTVATHRTASRLRPSRGLMRAMLLRGAADTTSFQAYGKLLDPPPESIRWWFPPAGAKRLELIDWIIAEAAKTEASDLHIEVLHAVATAFPSGRWEPRKDPGSLGLNWQLRGQTGKLVDSITIRISNFRPSQVWVMLFDEALQYAPRKLRDAVSELATTPGDRLGKPHGIAFSLSSEDWQRHGPALRNALTYAGAKHAKAIG